ncbi:hypothetical protein ACHAXA_011042 [Cyclostephanos tholiformis]|uniref:Uncharacterized protein n=1 Tax=Cyclostephanos tholiformis TaxID=382380 RepID=A0ABD3RYX1_9STRA
MNRRRMRPLLSSAMMMIVLPTPCPSFSVPRRENNHSPASSSITGTTTDPTWSDLTPSSRLATSALDDGPSRPSTGWRGRMRRRMSEEDDTDDRGVDYADESGTLVRQVEDDGEYGANDATTTKTTTTTESSSRCPMSFSMTFPRYRIEYGRSSSSSSSSSRDDRVESDKRRTRRLRRGIITKLRPRSRPEDDAVARGDDGIGSPLRILSDILGEVMNPSSIGGGNIARSRRWAESSYEGEIMMGNFRWASSSSPSPSEEAAGAVVSTTNTDEDFHAAAAFWKMASDIITYLATDLPPLEDNTLGQITWYLALPETTPSVARKLCDILNWYADYSSGRIATTEGGEEADLIIRTDLDSRCDENKIPVVMFNVTFDDGVIRQLRRRHERRSLLPKADTTEKRTKAWVKRLLVQLGICPFTKSEVRSGQGLKDLGVPVASIMYRHSESLGRGSDVYLLMADAWKAISDMVAAGPSRVSSILLSAPGFDDCFDLWAGPVFAMLESCVGAIQAEEIVGVVCFHPKYVTPDGQSWPGFGQMHSVPRLKKWYNQYNSVSSAPASSASPSLTDDEIAAGGAWQRRTPHAVINVLRAEQLEAAEGRRSTGELYGRNIHVLVGKGEGSVGLDKLFEDLKREQCL